MSSYLADDYHDYDYSVGYCDFDDFYDYDYNPGDPQVGSYLGVITGQDNLKMVMMMVKVMTKMVLVIKDHQDQ